VGGLVRRNIYLTLQVHTGVFTVGSKGAVAPNDSSWCCPPPPIIYYYASSTRAFEPLHSLKNAGYAIANSFIVSIMTKGLYKSELRRNVPNKHKYT